jgi:hypothetical protein
VVDSTELQTWLEWASARLLAMPGGKVKPAGLETLWPDYSQDRFQVLDFRAAITLRVLAPSSTEIPIMEEILFLPNLCTDTNTKRIIRLRSLVNPVSNRHLYKWPEIATKFTIKQYTARRLFDTGLREIARKANSATINQISAFMENEQREYAL